MKKEFNNATKSLDTEQARRSSEDEETDSTSDQTSSISEASRKCNKNATQFSVLRSDTNGLRMKISAIRNISDNTKCTIENNNLESSKVKKGIKKSSKKDCHNKKKEMPSTILTNSSCCSIFTQSENESNSEATRMDKARKIRLKKKKSSKSAIDNSSESESEKLTTTLSDLSTAINLRIKKTLGNLSDPVLPDNSMSSSDNEMLALVSAAIKCVESGSESDKCPLDEPPKNQYTSSLLQDFMAKTQMIGQTLEANSTASNVSVKDVVTTISTIKKRRGRPKKIDILAQQNPSTSVVIESADSGITSTAQSSSPSPKIVAMKKKATNPAMSVKKELPKEISNLAKRSLASVRGVYPPARSRRKSSYKLLRPVKDDILDPIWKKIDVNTKFRRPSLSGYKSDGGNTVCSKVLAAKSGYVSDYGSVYTRNHYSGYKSDASGKSRCSMRSCVSRARSESGKSRKYLKKRRSMLSSHAKSVINVNEQDILQLAGLSLGQSSEESNEYAGKPLLPSTNSAKKFGEINRFVTTGEYFGRRKSIVTEDNQDAESLLGGKLFLKSTPSTQISPADFSSELIDNLPRKIKSRRSSVASLCSSFSGVSKYRKHKRRRSIFRHSNRSGITDSKLIADIEIIINSFGTLCQIACDKNLKETNKAEKEKSTAQKVANKRNMKKRKLSESVELALLNSSSSTKRRHKKACSSSPDDHKLPLKKRHYLLTPGEKFSDVKAALLLDAKVKELGEIKVNGKGLSGSSGAKITSKAITPKKRHLLQTNQSSIDDSTVKGNNSPMQSDSKSSIQNAVPKNIETASNKKRNRLEGLVSKISSSTELSATPSMVKELDSEPSYPPPGVFEPSIALEIQIPITRLSDNSIITKSEVDSPLDLLDLNKTYPEAAKTERVVETLLNRTGGNLILKRKRKKINRTGFPTVKKKRRKITTDLDDDKEAIDVANETETEKDSPICDRVPQTGEASDIFVQRSKAPRLSVVSLERLQMPLEQEATGKRKAVAKRTPVSVQPDSTTTIKEELMKARVRARRNSLPVRINKKFEDFKPEQPQEVKSTKSMKKSAAPPPPPPTPKIVEAKISKRDKPESNHLEQDPLPDEESSIGYESTFSDVSERSGIRKQKKSYLPAGLFSDYFKTAITKDKRDKTDTRLSSIKSLLPPPPYCENFFRRSITDFQLPYDIWYGSTHPKIPSKHTVPSWNYKKIRTNLYSESVRPNTANVDNPTCNCKLTVGCGDDCLNRMVYTECSPSSCPTQDKCRNQKIQRHDVAPGVERFMTDNKGWGVRTRKEIKKGTYILEYVGEVVTEKEFKERMASLYAHDTHHYCLHLDGGLVIDGHRMGSDGRFVNHSCEPNCEMQKWSVNGLSRMALFAARHIEPDEELTYDYNFALFNPAEGQPCRCNADQCRGVIGGKSQRVKPLEIKPAEPNANARNGRQRKRAAKKNTIRIQSKDIVVPQLQPLSDKEKKVVKLSSCFLVRNLEKIRRLMTKPPTIKCESPGRPLTPSSSIAVQISALRVPRNIKTRGLTQAATDPEVEKMAKIALILKEICNDLENVKDNSDKSQLQKILPSSRKKRTTNSLEKNIAKSVDFVTIQSNIEKGFYKEPSMFDEDIQIIFTNAKKKNASNDAKLTIINELMKMYTEKKAQVSTRLLEIVDVSTLKNFCPLMEPITTSDCPHEMESPKKCNEDIIRCICGLFKDEGLMIQCSKCMVWQHTECTKADVAAENYMCERCDVSRKVDLEIPLQDFTEEGYRYYLSLVRGKLQIRSGDTVYVLRDIPIKDESGTVCGTSKKHTYETIGEIDYSECDIFRVERLWKNNEGKRFIFGHHYLRPHETFHEPTRKFYPNEVVRVPLYEVVPIELVIARCWVLDRTTFCKGRPADCTAEDHVYICELRVDKSARLFSKAKQSYPTCTKNYAFRKFKEKLKITKTYAPHDVDPSMLKKKRKQDEPAGSVSSLSTYSATSSSCKKTSVPSPIQLLPPPPQKTRTERRAYLENVLKNIKTKKPNTQLNIPPMDLSYLLTGRGARQRKAIASTVSMPT